jgi:hypothetical protein
MNKTIPFVSIAIAIAAAPLVSSATLLSTPNVVFGASAAAAVSGDDDDDDDDDKDHKKHRKCNTTTRMISTKSARTSQRLAKYGLRKTVRINFFLFKI